jgi:hypothetical protein
MKSVLFLLRALVEKLKNLIMYIRSINDEE